MYVLYMSLAFFSSIKKGITESGLKSPTILSVREMALPQKAQVVATVLREVITSAPQFLQA